MRARVLAVVLMAVLGGCNIVAPIFFLVHGPEKIPAAHKLEKARPTLVLIDDPASVVSRRQLRAEMGERLDKVLLEKVGLREVIDSRAAMSVLTKDRVSEPMSIAEVGRSLGAEVVIWVGIDAFTLSPDSQSYAPASRFRVKVIDATTGKRVWPEDPKGHPVSLDIPTRTKELPASTTAVIEAERRLAHQSGEAVARLFYDHERVRNIQVKDE